MLPQDPANLAKGSDDEIAKLQVAEIKHGRVAMIACLDYFVRGFGGHVSPTLLLLLGARVVYR
jgi:hypothetical protein